MCNYNVLENNLSFELRKKATLILALFSIALFTVFGFIHLIQNELVLGGIEIIAGIVEAGSLFWLKDIYKINRVVRIIVFVVMLVSIIVFFYGGIGNTGNLWIILVPLFPLMLLSYHEGLIWTLVYIFFMLIIIILGMANIYDSPFSYIQLRQTLLAFIMFNIIIYYNERIKHLACQTTQRSQKELREKDQLLFHQSKQAQMGEMISMIAHQWRQPLNAISANSIRLSLLNQLNQLDSDTIDSIGKSIQDATQYLSQIIDDFMKFNQPEQHITTFTIDDIIKEISIITKAQFTSRGINLILNGDDLNSSIFGYKKELSHILLNLFANARDAFDQNRVETQNITLNTRIENDTCIITVADNAGGIPIDIIDKIFDPYFTTKAEGKGTGIGLYMTKRIIEEIMGGTIKVWNELDGAVFEVSFPIIASVENQNSI